MLNRQMPIYETEYGVEGTTGSSARIQAENLGTAERLATSYPRVRSIGQYLLRDDPPEVWGLESGLRTYRSPVGDGCDGCKPSLDAFRVALSVRAYGQRVCVRKSRKARGGKGRRCLKRGIPKKVSIWGHVRPVRWRTQATVFITKGRRVRRLRRVPTNSNGYFLFRSKNVKGATWSVRWGGRTGPPIRALRW